MPHSIIFAEGSSDSALLTGALRRLGFASRRKLSDIPDSIVAHFPKSFPASGDFLNRVNSYPEVLEKSGHYIAIINTGGLTRLGESLKNSILLMKDELPFSAVVFVDADDQLEADRFNHVREVFRENFIKVATSRLSINGINAPERVGEITKGQVNTGVYIWPGAGSTGTLERVVLEGVHAEFPEVFDLVQNIPGEVRERYGIGHPVRITLDSGYNIDKAKSVMMGGAISPSANFGVYLSNESHRLNNFFSAPALARLALFLQSMLPRDPVAD